MNIFEETYRKEQEMVRQFDATDDEEETVNPGTDNEGTDEMEPVD